VVTKAEADGHILLFTTDGTFIFNPLIYSSLPYAVFATDLAYWSSHNDFAGRNQAMHARSSLHR
jgi:hypothetical protein